MTSQESREEIARRTAESRAACGLPPKITDAATLAKVAHNVWTWLNQQRPEPEDKDAAA